MRAWLDADLVVGSLRRFGQAFGPVAAVCGFALALTLAVPLVFLTLVALVAYGPMAGFGCAMAGAMLGAAASYGIGRFLGRDVVQGLGGERINRLSQRLASRGLLAVVAVRTNTPEPGAGALPKGWQRSRTGFVPTGAPFESVGHPYTLTHPDGITTDTGGQSRHRTALPARSRPRQI